MARLERPASQVVCGESLIDDGFSHVCTRPPHPDTEPHVAGIEFYSKNQGTMHAVLVWSEDVLTLPRTQYGLSES